MFRKIMILGLVLNSNYAFSGPDIKAGEAKVKAICSPCHGADGNSLNPIYPNLKGQKPEYIKKQIGDFKAGRRSNDNGIMKAMVLSLTDQDIENVAAYLSTKK